MGTKKLYDFSFLYKSVFISELYFKHIFEYFRQTGLIKKMMMMTILMIMLIAAILMMDNENYDYNEDENENQTRVEEGR